MELKAEQEFEATSLPREDDWKLEHTEAAGYVGPKESARVGSGK